MKTMIWLLSLALMLTVPLVGSAASSPITVGFAPATSKVVQIVARHTGGAWVKSDKVKKMPPARWQLFSLTGSGPDLRAGALEDDGTGSAIVATKSKVPYDALAVSGRSVTQPRKGRAVKASSALVAQITSLLKADGVKVEQARIVQCVQVDLLGDGDPEWLVIAASRDNISALGPERTDSDYSLAAMAWVTPRGDRDKSALRVHAIHLEGRLPKDRVSQDFRWIAVADLDGKGRMVAALRSQYYEGGGMELLSFDGTRVKSLVVDGWGL